MHMQIYACICLYISFYSYYTFWEECVPLGNNWGDMDFKQETWISNGWAIWTRWWSLSHTRWPRLDYSYEARAAHPRLVVSTSTAAHPFSSQLCCQLLPVQMRIDETKTRSEAGLVTKLYLSAPTATWLFGSYLIYVKELHLPSILIINMIKRLDSFFFSQQYYSHPIMSGKAMIIENGWASPCGGYRRRRQRWWGRPVAAQSGRRRCSSSSSRTRWWRWRGVSDSSWAAPQRRRSTPSRRRRSPPATRG